MDDNKDNKIEFTKILVSILIIIFYGFYLFSIVVWLKEDRYLYELAGYIAKVFAIVNSCYLIKSSIQNNVKVRKQFDETQVRKKFTFSKILILLISSSFILSTIFFCYIWYVNNEFPSEMFEYIATPFITVLPTYLAKAVVENYSLDSRHITDIVSNINDMVTTGSNIVDSILTDSENYREEHDINNEDSEVEDTEYTDDDTIYSVEDSGTSADGKG
jgi:hypothetical protein